MTKIITIDGYAASGKGELAKLVANYLGFYYFDSGILYRAIALLSKKINQNPSLNELIEIAKSITFVIEGDRVLLSDKTLYKDIRNEEIGILASKYASIKEIRVSLIDIQRNLGSLYSLVSDGRDMGSVIFPNAFLKVFLTANIDIRAERRLQQLINSNKYVTIDAVLSDIRARDGMDLGREFAPLYYDDTFLFIDNSKSTVSETVDLVLNAYKTK